MRGKQKRDYTTQERLVEAAIDVFGRRGFDATTTRMVVEKAGTQLTAISYYFANKEGLYRAAAEAIASGVTASFHESVERSKLSLAADRNRSELIELACGLLDGMAERLVGGHIPEAWSRFLSREMAEPTEAFPILFAAFEGVGWCLCEVIGRLRGRSTEDSDVILCMLTLVGQVLVFRSDRAATLAFLKWKKFGPAEMANVRAVLRDSVRRVLQEAVPELAG